MAREDEAAQFAGLDTKATMIAIAYVYDLSKRTSVGITYAQIDNDAAAKYNFFTGTSLGSPDAAAMGARGRSDVHPADPASRVLRRVSQSAALNGRRKAPVFFAYTWRHASRRPTDRRLRYRAAHGGGRAPRASRVSCGGDCRRRISMSPQREHAAALMRVNHVGEVCAQALYQGQALTARNSTRSGRRWSRQRRRRRTISPGARSASTSSAARRACSIRSGTPARSRSAWPRARWATAGTSRSSPKPSTRSRSISAGISSGSRPRMRARARSSRRCARTKSRHRETAVALGAAELPQPAKLAMRALAKVMTTVAYRV